MQYFSISFYVTVFYLIQLQENRALSLIKVWLEGLSFFKKINFLFFSLKNFLSPLSFSKIFTFSLFWSFYLIWDSTSLNESRIFYNSVMICPGLNNKLFYIIKWNEKDENISCQKSLIKNSSTFSLTIWLNFSQNNHAYPPSQNKNKISVLHIQKKCFIEWSSLVIFSLMFSVLSLIGWWTSLLMKFIS